MKKSELFRMAQIAVVEANTIMPSVKLDILRVLMSEEDINKLCEEHDEQEGDGINGEL